MSFLSDEKMEESTSLKYFKLALSKEGFTTRKMRLHSAFPNPNSAIVLSKEDFTTRRVRQFQKMIIHYYQTHGRKLPWRETTNPYAILVSEMMLQQTQSDRVIDKYQQFITIFPDFSSLARAPLQNVLTVWLGLGYNRRAIALKKTAEMVGEKFNGKLPASEKELMTLPGIGKYTASAIAVFAFNQPVVLLETNIRTVFIHFFFDDSIRVSDKEIIPLIEKTLDVSNPRRWYNALIDYGAMLKKIYPNSGKRSIHYKKQSPFKGSDRQIRGMILKSLTQGTAMTAQDILREIGENPERVKKILFQLQEEGFVKKIGFRFLII